MPHFLFFDMNADKINDYKKILGSIKNTSFFIGTLDNLVKLHNFNVIVSPANSFGVMTGGIDSDIAKKWPDVVKNTLDVVKKSKHFDSSGNNYIPVGMCEGVLLDNKRKNKCMLVAPTMFLPKYIVGTQNVFLAFNAILGKTKSLDSSVIIACPCLGTGIGGMSGEESALQIKEAFQKNINIIKNI